MGPRGPGPQLFQKIKKYFCLKSSLHRFWSRGRPMYPMHRSSVIFYWLFGGVSCFRGPRAFVYVCKFVKIMKINWHEVKLLQWVAFLLDHILIYAYCLILPCSHSKKHFSLQKCRKIRDFNVNFFKFFWGHSPQTPILGRGYGAPPQTSLPSALRRFATPAPLSGPSVPPSSGGGRYLPPS